MLLFLKLKENQRNDIKNIQKVAIVASSAINKFKTIAPPVTTTNLLDNQDASSDLRNENDIHQCILYATFTCQNRRSQAKHYKYMNDILIDRENFLFFIGLNLLA